MIGKRLLLSPTDPTPINNNSTSNKSNPFTSLLPLTTTSTLITTLRRLHEINSASIINKVLDDSISLDYQQLGIDNNTSNNTTLHQFVGGLALIGGYRDQILRKGGRVLICDAQTTFNYQARDMMLGTLIGFDETEPTAKVIFDDSIPKSISMVPLASMSSVVQVNSISILIIFCPSPNPVLIITFYTFFIIW